ncbi:MAG: hypothetical protein KatS3mg096_241 [Candidatus Parcubacteria bacterium]|nr:MAG: hypothetical protein KatS3mg096_241 [Candidatus Parcubacteria bacterium]
MAEQMAKKIVLIDDEKSFVELFSFVLKKEGFDVIGFTDPQEALKNISVCKNTDLILLDLSMPILNGFSLFCYLQRDLGKECPPIILITNLQYNNDGTKIDDNYAKSIGAVGVIRKTTDLPDIIKKIKEFLQ